jgi:hypothetical protein
MKTTIIEMLEFPRQVIRGHIEFETCGHAGNFSSSDPACLVCETRMECEWLYHNDEFVALTEKPLDAVVDAFGLALLYVDACLTRAEHDVGSCRCEACDWLRRARQIYAAAGRSVR